MSYCVQRKWLERTFRRRFFTRLFDRLEEKRIYVDERDRTQTAYHEWGQREGELKGLFEVGSVL